MGGGACHGWEAILPILFLLFLIVPIVEIYLLIKVGGVIGAFSTIFLVIFTAVLGAFLLRQQGFATMQRVQQSLAQGQLPAMAMLEGLVLLIAGALLLTPGFFTDTIGFLCLVPPMRRWMIRRLMQNVLVKGFGPASGPQHDGSSQEPPPGSRVIEGEYRREDDRGASKN